MKNVIKISRGEPGKIGHKSSKTTESYTQASERNMERIRSPVDTFLKGRNGSSKK